jgi:hypothetical protein
VAKDRKNRKDKTYTIFSKWHTPVTASLNPLFGSSIRRMVPERFAHSRRRVKAKPSLLTSVTYGESETSVDAILFKFPALVASLLIA